MGFSVCWEGKNVEPRVRPRALSASRFRPLADCNRWLGILGPREAASVGLPASMALSSERPVLSSTIVIRGGSRGGGVSFSSSFFLSKKWRA